MKIWRKLLRDNFFLILLVGVILSFFYPSILYGKIPIPADTIVGMYHPWRDNIWDGFTAGVPYKNYLITDPVRQQYVWRKLAIDELREGRLPVWNPYTFSGTPLLANFQSALFYPLNILFFILPFNLAWSILVISQPLFAGIFLYIYLRHMKISALGSFFGGFTFAFSGFSIAWLEWNTILATALWLPLILLSADKIIQILHDISKTKGLIWIFVFVFSLTSSFFAGHLQIFFYSLLISISYIFLRIFNQTRYRLKTFLLFVVCYLLFVIITSIQWLPTLQFIVQSSRDFDQGSFTKEGWFIPWQHLVQFLVPDFFGNPATGNYWGVWNYGEFIGFIGIAPLIFALYALFFRRDKKTLFFGSFTVLSLMFALPTSVARFPFQLNLPLISTSQPTRLLFLTDFTLALLSAFGLDYLSKQKSSIVQIIKLLIPLGIIYGTIWFFVLFANNFGIAILKENIFIARRNLVLPTVIALLVIANFVSLSLFRRRKSLVTLLYCLIAFITIIELFRFGWKFTPFTKEEWLFPKTKILETINQEMDQYRIMAIDRRIMPPNFAGFYGINDISGYDPLYLKSYNQLVSAWDRSKADISPASYNRIITPSNYESFIADLLGVKYVISLTPLKSDKLEFLSREGNTYLYVNEEVFPRVFLVENLAKVKNSQEAIDMMFNLGKNLRVTAVVEEDIQLKPIPLQSYEMATITYYSPNHITLTTDTITDRVLVLSDIYYPSWKVFIDSKVSKIYRVNFALRGVLVPAGEHKIEFKNSLL